MRLFARSQRSTGDCANRAHVGGRLGADCVEHDEIHLERRCLTFYGSRRSRDANWRPAWALGQSQAGTASVMRQIAGWRRSIRSLRTNAWRVVALRSVHAAFTCSAVTIISIGRAGEPGLDANRTSDICYIRNDGLPGIVHVIWSRLNALVLSGRVLSWRASNTSGQCVLCRGTCLEEQRWLGLHGAQDLQHRPGRAELSPPNPTAFTDVSRDTRRGDQHGWQGALARQLVVFVERLWRSVKYASDIDLRA